MSYVFLFLWYCTLYHELRPDCVCLTCSITLNMKDLGQRGCVQIPTRAAHWVLLREHYVVVNTRMLCFLDVQHKFHLFVFLG